jgi:hypothetical protein
MNLSAEGHTANSEEASCAVLPDATLMPSAQH